MECQLLYPPTHMPSPWPVRLPTCLHPHLGPLCSRPRQVLAPTLVARGRVFGSALHLNGADWRCIDKAYFDAPGRSEVDSGFPKVNSRG